MAQRAYTSVRPIDAHDGTQRHSSAKCDMFGYGIKRCLWPIRGAVTTSRSSASDVSVDRSVGRCWFDWWAKSLTLIDSVEAEMVVTAFDSRWAARGRLIDETNDVFDSFGFLSSCSASTARGAVPPHGTGSWYRLLVAWVPVDRPDG